MKKIVLFGLLSVVLMFLSACGPSDADVDDDTGDTPDEVLVCNAPFIMQADECCLDTDNNGVCDRDERVLTEDEIEEEEAANIPDEDGTDAPGNGDLNLQITDKKPETLNITGLEVTLSEITVHVAGGGSTSDEECTTETVVEEVCTNESETEEVCVNETVTAEVCVNETVTEEVCVNVTINDSTVENCTNVTTVVPNCTNETTTEEVCHNETINDTNETCENETTEIETCTNGSETSSAGWFTVVEGPVTFDLIEIKDVKEFLGSTELTAGKYTQIRLFIEDAKLFLSGNETPLTIPSGKLKLNKNFNIAEGQTTTLTLDFDAEKSVHQAGSKYIMKPTIKVIQED